MTHIDPSILMEYWLSQSDDDSVAEHLLACSQCSEALESVARFAGGVQEVVRRGNLSVVLPPEFLARLSAEGLRIRTYAPPAGGGVECTVTSADDLLMTRLRTDLSSVSRLDVEFLAQNGEIRGRLEDVPFRPGTTAQIVLNQPMDWVRSMGPDVLIVKLLAVENGADRQLAEYTFNHTPSPE